MSGLRLWSVVILFLLLPQAGFPAKRASLDMGEDFPDFPLPVPQETAQRAYLGLPEGETFRLSQVGGQVVLVELLNVLCPHCRKQTKPYNQLYQMIEADPATRGRIKMLGVAVANTDEQIEDFVEVYAVAFPVVADRNFALHRALRAGPTPLSLYVLQDTAGGAGIVAGSHLGEDRDMTALFAYLKELTGMQRADFEGLAEKVPVETAALESPLTPGELGQRLRQAFATTGGAVEEIQPLNLPSGRKVYAAIVNGAAGRRQLFAEVVGRSAICDVCHDVHFFYLFDQQGRILAFEPLHLTKYGNVEWNATDLAFTQRRLVGKNMAEIGSFDPKVDAVTSATMTSAIIFDSFVQGAELLAELQNNAGH